MPGGPVGADDLVVVSHLSPHSAGRNEQPVYLGYLFVEPRRHAAGLADLTEPEAQAHLLRELLIHRRAAGLGD